jgi:hypothetical protein
MFEQEIKMTTLQAIAQRIEELPEAAQREVLDFVEFLRAKNRSELTRETDDAWSSQSLISAMRGMEDEPSPYTANDIKDTFR